MTLFDYGSRRIAPVFMFVTACCFIGGSALAHIKNEASQFPDIEFSASRFDIVVLVGIGVIPETPVFEPDKLLSRKELATWAALASDLGAGGETPDADALAKAAVEQGLVDSLDGDASLAELNRAIFNFHLSLSDGGKVPSKAEAASLIAGQLQTDTGAELLARKGLSFGDTGVVSAVVPGDSHHGVTTYSMTIGATSLPMDAHGRVANGPVDLLQWEGRTVGRSFVRGEGHHAAWIYLETEQEPEVVAPEPEAVTEMATTVEPRAPTDRRLLIGLSMAVVIIGFLLFVRRRRRD